MQGNVIQLLRGSGCCHNRNKVKSLSTCRSGIKAGKLLGSTERCLCSLYVTAPHAGPDRLFGLLTEFCAVTFYSGLLISYLFTENCGGFREWRLKINGFPKVRIRTNSARESSDVKINDFLITEQRKRRKPQRHVIRKEMFI